MNKAVERRDAFHDQGHGALSVGYFNLEELRELPATEWQQVLGLVRFGTDRAEPLSVPVPVATVVTPALSPAGGAAEVWRFAGAMRSGSTDRLQYRCSEEYVFASTAVDERELLAAGAG